MIIGSWWIICVFVLLKNSCTADTVYSQDDVEGVTGKSVILQCKSNKNDQKLQDINVLWKYNGSTNVLAILNGEASVEHQSLKFKNRTQTFPDEYRRGNFTLKLNNLTHTDAGQYQCYITHSSERVTVQLLVNESPEEKASDLEGGGKRTILILVFCFSLFIVAIVCIVIPFVMKRGNKTSSSGVSATGACLSCPAWLKPISNTPKSTNQNNQDYAGLPSNSGTDASK